jgi:hypothetical protein
MSYLARLKQLDIEKNHCIPPNTEPTKPSKPPFVGFVGSFLGHIEKKIIDDGGAKSDESAIRAWLAHINETDSGIIAEVLDKCRADSSARAYFLWRAEEVPRPMPEDDDRRTCDRCANPIARRCQAAKRGEIVASRNYEPVRDLLRRCEGYAPGPDDPDRRTGQERWPGLIQKEGE